MTSWKHLAPRTQYILNSIWSQFVLFETMDRTLLVSDAAMAVNDTQNSTVQAATLIVSTLLANNSEIASPNSSVLKVLDANSTHVRLGSGRHEAPQNPHAVLVLYLVLVRSLMSLRVLCNETFDVFSTHLMTFSSWQTRRCSSLLLAHSLGWSCGKKNTRNHMKRWAFFSSVWNAWPFQGLNSGKQFSITDFILACAGQPGWVRVDSHTIVHQPFVQASSWKLKWLWNVCWFVEEAYAHCRQI